jgi:CRISPR-associated helicase Cas3
MPRLIEFQNCIARPGSSLPDHLLSVKKSMESFLQYDFDPVTVRLAGLAGICHDLAKANSDWQQYIQNPNIKKGPNHSPCGAFLFSFLGFQLLESRSAWDDKKREWLWLIHDIQNHHGMLGDITNENWLKKYEWEKFDLSGIEKFLKEQYEELGKITLNERNLVHWISECKDRLEETYDELDLSYLEWESLSIMKEVQKWRQMTTALISGDRFHIKQIETSWLDKTDSEKFMDRIGEFGEKNQGQPFASIRIQAQQEILSQLRRNPNQLFYTLEMPTGYGKTIASIKMAAWFGKNQGYRKLIYVAPYLSILEQTAGVMEDLLDVSVLQHHSLALVNEDPNQRVSFSQLAMESWAHSIVCTSFQQFCKAIFPERSQDVLRRAFLKDAVVIIDEPQIFNPEIWNLFLCGLEAMAQLVNMKVIFLSATMPPFNIGLTNSPCSLSFKGKKGVERYRIQVMKEPLNEETIGQFMKKNERKTQAIIVNTVKDAYLVFSKIREDVKNSYLIHGLMTPIHKKMLIDKIKEQLKKTQKEPLYVVSTQVLEAGVDVSFQYIARALPILPAIVQTAGRVNRHMEDGQMGILHVFPFFRGGVKDTRSFIYPKPLQKITDEIIFSKSEFFESEMNELVKDYYNEMFHQNTYETALQRITDAYEGRWERLSEISPFKEQYFTLPIFIPFDPEIGETPERVKNLKSDIRSQMHGPFMKNTEIEIF